LQKRRKARHKQLASAGVPQEAMEESLAKMEKDEKIARYQLKMDQGLREADKFSTQMISQSAVMNATRKLKGAIRAIKLMRGMSGLSRVRKNETASILEREALEKTREEAEKLERVRGDRLNEARAEHEKELAMLENQLDQELSHKEEQLRRRLADRRKQKQRHTADGAVKGPIQEAEDDPDHLKEFEAEALELKQEHEEKKRAMLEEKKEKIILQTNYTIVITSGF
jgi:hypothetical protein